MRLVFDSNEFIFGLDEESDVPLRTAVARLWHGRYPIKGPDT